jgi:hypothetical protein
MKSARFTYYNFTGRNFSKKHFRAGSCTQENTTYCQYNIMWCLVTENYRGLLWEQNEPHKYSVGGMLRYRSPNMC